MNLEKIQEQLFDATKSQNQVIFQETLALTKLKNTWIAQIVTISGTILGGVSVFSDSKSILTFLGLGILFVTIVIGLLFIVNNLNNETNKLLEHYANFNDYNLRAIMLAELELKNEELSPEEIQLKDKIEEELRKIANKLDIIDENGELKMLSDKLKTERINIGNYILIGGLAIGGILITMSELINCYLFF